MSLIAEPLIQYLQQLQRQGRSHVNVDEAARLLLRAFYKQALNPSAGSVQSSRLAEVPESGRSVQVQPSSAPAVAAVEAAQATQPEQVAAVGLQAKGANAEEKIAYLKEQAAQWAPAKALGSFRDTMVFSAGNPLADIMLVGEAPGFDEERLREPFSGKAGQKLDAILRAMGTERQQVYISNIVKRRPKMLNQTTSNRKPTADELAAWLPFISEEVKVVAPKAIIALGGVAAQAMLKLEQPVRQLRGQFHSFEGVPLRVTYHPSYILNDQATEEKRMLWLDMLSVMELLAMPISDKQRGYFAKK